MNCPVCRDVTLVISSREGVEIDHCPQCRGVWLDRGELDKIIDRTVVDAPPDRRSSSERDERWQPSKRHKKKESMFERFFDFD